ncbi:MAG: hypothetical protein MJZ37_06350 [Bacilli bacterium]|nr:hypothetical protein [Bacilli bacterium]
MKNLKSVEAMVKKALEEYPEARSDDFILIARVYEQINPMFMFDNFSYIMTNHKDLHLPCFESIRRTRQKLQSKYEELRPSKEAQEFRTAAEEAYIEYARE